MEIRELQVKDVFAVARMLGKITKGARMELASVLADRGKDKKKAKTNPTELGMVLFQSLVTEAEEDMKAWLADLMGKEVAEFETMPPSTILDIVDKLTDQKGIKDFFARASSLATKLTG